MAGANLLQSAKGKGVEDELSRRDSGNGKCQEKLDDDLKNIILPFLIGMLWGLCT